jgi:hypothetical protein
LDEDQKKLDMDAKLAKRAVERATRRFNESSAALKILRGVGSSLGHRLARSPRSQLEPPSHRSREELSHKLVSGFAEGSIAVNAAAVNLNTNVKKYENSTSSKTNSPLAFAARSTFHRTGAGYHRRVGSRAGPRNPRVRYYKYQPFIPRAGRLLSGRLARLDV